MVGASVDKDNAIHDEELSNDDVSNQINESEDEDGEEDGDRNEFQDEDENEDEANGTKHLTNEY